MYNTTADGWIEWRGYQYYINKLSMTAEDARHFCQQRHGDLVSLSTKDENVFLWKQVVMFWLEKHHIHIRHILTPARTI